MLVRLVQPRKAEPPILVTLSGIAMLARPLLLKAEVPMLVTGFPSMVSGITSLPLAAPSQSMILIFPSVVA
jgi:hypothetical protein